VEREHVDLGEGAWVEQLVDALASRQLAFGVLLVECLSVTVPRFVFALT